jgi:pimeloyl-ACP methyl ester carboxylesterase
MKRTALAGIAMLLVLGACSSNVPSLTYREKNYADRWLIFAEPALAEAYRGVNLYETERMNSGRLVLADGTSVPLRLWPDPQAELAFIVPALGASFSVEQQRGDEWQGRWADPVRGETTATLLPASASPIETLGQLVVLPDGRRVHLTCAGEGTPVVLLDYGAGGTMKRDWGDIAKRAAEQAQTKVCAYDRAGRGLSDPPFMPLDAAAVADNIDSLLTAANFPPPYILVGHSLGSYHVRQFANTRAAKTAGLVLIDPSGDGQLERFNAAIPQMAQLQADRVKTQADLNCVDRLLAKPVPPDDPLAQQCGGNDPDAILATLSEIEEMPGASTASLVATRRSYGDMPVIVLTRTDYEAGMPPTFTQQDKDAMRSIWESMHAEMAALSTRGDQRFIPNAGHYIQRDAPEAVVAAVADVVAAVRAGPE